jgi:hypothetical protein
MEYNPLKEINESEMGKAMLKSWKTFIEENEGCYAEDSIETADFYAGFEAAWENQITKIKKLQERVTAAEIAMGSAWSMCSDYLIPGSSAIGNSLKKYREKYPEALAYELENKK